MKKWHLILDILIFVTMIAILVLMIIAGSSVIAKAVTLKPVKYARDDHGVYTSQISPSVKKKAKKSHKTIRKGKSRHYWMHGKSTNEIRSVLAYMSEFYLAYQDKGEYVGDTFRSAKNGYELDLHPRLYKRLRKHDRYVKDIIQSAIKQMQITTFTPDADAVEKVNAWICDRVDYDWKGLNDENAPVRYNAYQGLKYGVCVCEGYADIFQIFMVELGIRAYRVESWDHIWNSVIIGGEALQVDVCWNDVGNDRRWMLQRIFTDHGKIEGIRDNFHVTAKGKRVFYNTKRGY